MGIILITVASILVLTAVTVGINATRVLPWGICPICAGVSGTWAWMLLGILANIIPTSDFQLPTSILMGGSIVGIAYQLEDRLASGRSPFAWKVSFMTIGFALVMAVLGSAWGFAAGMLLLELGVVWWFLFSGFAGSKAGANEQESRVKNIEERMKKCC